MKNILITIIAVIIAIAVVLVGSKIYYDKKIQETKIVEEEDTNITVTTEVIEIGLRDIGELITQESYFKEVGTIEKDNFSVGSVSIPLTDATTTAIEVQNANLTITRIS